MGVWEMIVGILVLLLSIIMVIVIILQEGHQAGLGTVTGGADSFLSKGKARTADAIFARVTKYCAITFFVLVVLLNALSFFGITGDSIDNNAASQKKIPRLPKMAVRQRTPERMNPRRVLYPRKVPKQKVVRQVQRKAVLQA